MKKLLLSLGALTIIATPLALVVSCGDDDNDGMKYGFSLHKTDAAKGLKVIIGKKSVEGIQEGEYYLPAKTKGAKVQIIKESSSKSSKNVTLSLNKAITGTAIDATTFKIDGKIVATGMIVETPAAGDIYIKAESVKDVELYVDSVDIAEQVTKWFQGNSKSKEYIKAKSATKPTEAAQSTIDALNEVLSPIDKQVVSVGIIPASGDSPIRLANLKIGPKVA